GRFLVYTGTAIVDGTQMLRGALYARLAGCSFIFQEIDPDVFGGELESPPYDRADRIVAVAITVHAGRSEGLAVDDARRPRLDEARHRARWPPLCPFPRRPGQVQCCEPAAARERRCLA